MDLLRHFKGIFIDSSEESESITEYIDLILDRLGSSVRLEDKIEAVKALSSFAKLDKYKIEIGARSIDPLVSILEQNQVSSELIVNTLDCLTLIVNLSTSEESYYQFTEIYLKDAKHLAIILKLIEEYEFSIRFSALKFFKMLLQNDAKLVQSSMLKIENGFSKILDLLEDAREVIRNDAILTLVDLANSNKDIQNIIAFENGFDHILHILTMEDYSNGGCVTQDCLKLLMNLLHSNSSTQLLFREQGCFQSIVRPFMDSIARQPDIESDDNNNNFMIDLHENALNKKEKIGSQDSTSKNNEPSLAVSDTTKAENNNSSSPTFDNNKIRNIFMMLKMIKTFVCPLQAQSASSNVLHSVRASQIVLARNGILQCICDNLLMASGVPSELLIQSILTVGHIIKGCLENQDFFATLMAPSQPPRPFIDILLCSMLNEQKPLLLRRVILQFFYCLVYANPTLRHKIIAPITTNTNSTNNPKQLIIAPILLNALLTSSGAAILHINDYDVASELILDPITHKKTETLNTWFACLALSYCLSTSSHQTDNKITNNTSNDKVKGGTNTVGNENKSDTILNDIKEQLLKVKFKLPLTTTATTPQTNVDNNTHTLQNNESNQQSFQDCSLMEYIVGIFQKTKNMHSKIGSLIFLSHWLSNSSTVTSAFLETSSSPIILKITKKKNNDITNFLISQITGDYTNQSGYSKHKSTNKSNKNKSIKKEDAFTSSSDDDGYYHAEKKISDDFAYLSGVIQGLSAFLFGLIALGVSDETAQNKFKDIVKKRLGLDMYTSKLAFVRNSYRELNGSEENGTGASESFVLEKIGRLAMRSYLLKTGLPSPITMNTTADVKAPDMEKQNTPEMKEHTDATKRYDDQVAKITQNLCVYGSMFFKHFLFYETFILRNFGSDNNQDNYKLEQIEYFTRKYEGTIQQKEKTIESLNGKCGEYQKQLDYLTTKYEELNQHMKSLQAQRETEQIMNDQYQKQIQFNAAHMQNLSMNPNGPHPNVMLPNPINYQFNMYNMQPTPTPPINQNTNYDRSLKSEEFANYNNNINMGMNGMVNYSLSHENNAQNYPMVPTNYNQNYATGVPSTQNNAVYYGIMAPPPAQDQSSNPVQNQPIQQTDNVNANVNYQYPLVQTPYFPSGYSQDFYMNDPYYDTNLVRNFTLTTVSAKPKSSSEAGDTAPNVDVGSEKGDLESIGRSTTLDLNEISIINSVSGNDALTKLKRENEKLKLKNEELQNELSKMQKEQEGFIILIDEYEKRLSQTNATVTPINNEVYKTTMQNGVNENDFTAIHYGYNIINEAELTNETSGMSRPSPPKSPI